MGVIRRGSSSGKEGNFQMPRTVPDGMSWPSLDGRAFPIMGGMRGQVGWTPGTLAVMILFFFFLLFSS